MKDPATRHCILFLSLLAAAIVCAMCFARERSLTETLVFDLGLSEEHLAAAREEADRLRGALAAAREESEESQSEVRALRLSLQGLERDLAACQARAEKHPGPEPAPPGPAGSPPRARPAPPAPPNPPCPIRCQSRCRKGKYRCQ